jgi:hypothetical protein
MLYSLDAWVVRVASNLVTHQCVMVRGVRTAVGLRTYGHAYCRMIEWTMLPEIVGSAPRVLAVVVALDTYRITFVVIH